MARIGILQARASKTKDEAKRRVEQVLAKSRVEADVIVMPEYLMTDPTGLPPSELSKIAEPVGGTWTRWLERLSDEYGSCIIASMFEEGPGKPYNTIVLAQPGRGVVYTYRKTHLFDALGYSESSILSPGSEPPRTINACGLRLGAVVCFELRFPELFRMLALEGADLVAVPAGWYRGDGKEEALRFLAQARAHENTMYIAVASLYGANFTGRSMLVDPMGIVVLDLGHGERYAEADLDPGALEEARSRLPVLRLRRPGLYRL
ncbi:MAG: carbon-nitrogen hydrolase family protein [Desulfurococcales archaeon]|nr:carbon-nitrogen hydrolase family protein [Desulfurococcales archaeon]